MRSQEGTQHATISNIQPLESGFWRWQIMPTHKRDSKLVPCALNLSKTKEYLSYFNSDNPFRETSEVHEWQNKKSFQTFSLQKLETIAIFFLVLGQTASLLVLLIHFRESKRSFGMQARVMPHFPSSCLRPCGNKYFFACEGAPTSTYLRRFSLTKRKRCT